MSQPPPPRSERFLSRERRELRRELLVRPEPELGLVAMNGPGDPEPALEIEDGRVVGIVSPGLALDAVERGDGDESIMATMVRKGEAVELSPFMPIDEGFSALSGDQTTGVVVDGGRVLGILRRSDLARAVLEDHEAANGSVVPVAPEPVRVSW